MGIESVDDEGQKVVLLIGRGMFPRHIILSDFAAATADSHDPSTTCGWPDVREALDTIGGSPDPVGPKEVSRF